MKKLLIIFSALLISVASTAQGNEKVKELGVIFSQGNSYGVTYRFGNERALWRINAVSLFNQELSFEYTNHGYSYDYDDVRASIGREYRIPIGQHVAFRYGADVSLAYGKHNIHYYQELGFVNSSVRQVVESYSPSINLVLGLSYQIKRFVIGAELQPNGGYRIATFDSKFNNGTTSKEEMTYWYYGLNNSPIVFTAVYQF